MNMKLKNRLRSAFIVVLALGLLSGGCASVALAQSGVVPTQFIMKLYTEGLGRIPSASEWASATSYFSTNGCSLATLTAIGTPIFTGTEFSNLGYDNAAQLLALTRVVTNGELAQAEFNNDLSALNSGAYTWSQMVSAGFNSSQFVALVPAICNTSGQDSAAYWFGYNGTSFNTIPAPVLPLSNDTGFAGGTGAQLQALLNAAPPGGTVVLRQKSVTSISSALVIPAGVTLTTSNLGSAPPTTAQYALMGRIVLTDPATLQGPAIILMPGATMTNVWYDGQKNDYHLNAQETLATGPNVGVALWGGSGTQLLNSKVSNSNGWRYVGAYDTLWGATACTATISGNFLELYSTEHWLQNGQGYRVSGIEAWCQNATVTNNTIVDASDWGLGIMPFDGTVNANGDFTPCQTSCPPNISVASSNTTANAGNSAFVGMGYSAEGSLTGKQILSYQGSSIQNNVIWGSSRVHIVMATAVGLRTHLGNNANIVDYPNFVNNQIGLNSSNPLTVEEAGSFNASYDSGASGNFGWVNITNSGFAATCPLGGTVAGVAATWASWLGTPPSGWVNADMYDCDSE